MSRGRSETTHEPPLRRRSPAPSPRRGDRRGAAVDPPRRHPRGHHDAHPGPRLRAGRRVLPHRGPARRGRGAHLPVLRHRHGRRHRVQRRLRRHRRSRPGARAPPRAGHVVVRAVRIDLDRRAGRPPRRRCPPWTARRSTCWPPPRTGCAPPRACSTAPARCTPPAPSPPTAPCSWCARTSVATTPSTRWSDACCSTGRCRPPGWGWPSAVGPRFEIVQKAWAAGFASMVAVSGPSALAVETARRAGLVLMGFARDGGGNLYAPVDGGPSAPSR